MSVDCRTAGSGIARTVFFFRLHAPPYDTTWIGYYIDAWAVIELQMGIICACAPALKAFLGASLRSEDRKPYTPQRVPTAPSKELSTAVWDWRTEDTDTKTDEGRVDDSRFIVTR